MNAPVLVLQQGLMQLPATGMQVAFGESLASDPALQHFHVSGTSTVGASRVLHCLRHRRTQLVLKP